MIAQQCAGVSKPITGRAEPVTRAMTNFINELRSVCPQRGGPAVCHARGEELGLNMAESRRLLQFSQWRVFGERLWPSYNGKQIASGSGITCLKTARNTNISIYSRKPFKNYLFFNCSLRLWTANSIRVVMLLA